MEPPITMFKCEICLTCYPEPGECHARPTIHCTCAGDDCRKPPLAPDGQLKTREPRWWVQARNQAQAGRR